MITAANEVVNDPSSVGTALKTLTLRLRGSKTELEEAGLDIENMATTTSQLQAKLLALTGGKVDIMLDENTFKNTTQILREMAEAWDDMDDISRASALELMGGKRQANTLSALIQNFDTVEEVIETSAKSAGSALRENEHYLDSIQGKIDQFNNATQALWSNFLDADVVKFFVNIGTQLIKWVDNFGLIKTLIMGIGTYLIQKHFKGDLIGGLFGNSTSIDSVKKQITDLEATYARAKEKFSATGSTEDRKAMEDAEANLNAFKKHNQPAIDLDAQKTALNEQLENLKAEREQLQGDLQSAQDNLVDITINGVQKDVKDFIEIDTSHIDNEIAGVQEKLNLAKQELAEMPSGKKSWDFYKSMGSITPAKDRNNRIDIKKQEIKDLETELNSLQAKKDEFMSSEIDNVVSEGARAQVDDLTNKIGETDEAIKKTELELQNVEAQANATGNAGQTAGNKIKTGFANGAKAVWKFSKELAKSMAYTLAITAVMEALGNIWNGLTPLFKGMDKSPEALQEKLSELQNELSSVESELSSLESKLESTDERIEDLMSQGSLTFVEQEELNKLKSVSAELKSQIALQETLRKSLQQSTNSASIEATSAYLDTSFMSDKSKTEKQEEAKETGSAIGQVAGTIIGGIVGTIIGGGITLASGGTAAVPGAAIGIAAGSAIAGWIGGEAGSAIAGSSYDSEQTVAEAMDSMLETRAKLKEEQDNALAEKDVEAYNEATEALRTYDTQMSKHISQIQQNYNAMDWELADPETRKEMMEYADWLDKYNISMGTDGAKSNAIARIFGDEASDELKEIKQRMQEAAEAGEELSLADAFNGDEEAYNAFKTRLYNLGLTVYETEQYFISQKNAAEDAIDAIETYDAIKNIQKLTSGVNDLKNAFKELHDEGIVSVDTLLGLEDTFGDISGWKEFFEVMSSGTATMEESEAAAKNLAENYVDKILSSGSLSDQERLTTISRLQSLGITNASEFIDAKIKKNVVTDVISKNIGLTDAEKNELKELEALREQGKMDGRKRVRYQALINKRDGTGEYFGVDGMIKKIEESYGISLDSTEDRWLVEKAITAEKLKQEALDKQAAKNAYDAAVTDYNVAKEKNQAIDDEINILSGKSTSDLQGSYGVGQIEYTGGMVPRPYVRYNGKTYYLNYDGSPTQELRDAIAANLASQKVEIPSLPVEVTQIDVDNANNAAETAAAQLQTELDKQGLTLEINLIDPNELIDEAQSIYDTLASAAKEYGETGYVSVDTLQSLLQLEPKYLALLYDENGQLNLNKESMYQLTVARVTDMGIQQAQQVIETARTALLDGNIEKLRELTEVTYGQATSNWELVKSNLALLKTEMEDAGVDSSVYDGIASQVLAIHDLTTTTIANIGNTISSSGNTAASEVEDAFQKLMDYYDNRISANQAKYDQIQNDIDWLESQGKMADANYYRDQIALMTVGENSKEQLLTDKLNAAKDRLQELEATGKEGSEEWWEAASIYNDTLSELDDVRDTVLELQDAIGEIEWSAFEEFNSRLDDITSKLETMRDLIAPDGEEDWFDDEGNWTEKGVAVLGSYVQELEYYKNGLDQASDALDDFNEKSSYEGNEQWYADNYGVHSEQEYYDYLQKLTDEQYKHATSVSDTEQEIADMYESSIDAAEEYIETLVDSYNDYIDSVKEALDAERDLYNFKKNVKKQTKDIASLERRISALSGSTNAADIAERRKLEAQLAEQREELNDTYYEHSVDSQQEALDKEAQAYEEAMNKFVENLRTNLDLALVDMEGFISGVTTAVTSNAPLILDEYEKLGVALDSAIVAPWQAAEDAMDGYTKEDGLGLMNSWTAEGGVFDTFATDASDYLTSIWTDTNIDPDDAFENAITSKVEGIKENIRKNVEIIKGYWNDVNNVADTSVEAPPRGNGGNGGNGGGTSYDANVAALQEVLNSVFNADLTVDGRLGKATTAAIKEAQYMINRYYKSTVIYPDGIYGAKTRNAMVEYIDDKIKDMKNTSSSSVVGQGVQMYSAMKKKLPTAFYAKGTLGTKRDELAITDELGPELKMYATPEGNLSYMAIGSTVIPHDLTMDLIELPSVVDGLINKPKFDSGINMISNAINKPEIKLDIENFLNVGRVDQDTLPALEKMMDKKINDFSRQLNYALKGKGAR